MTRASLFIPLILAVMLAACCESEKRCVPQDSLEHRLLEEVNQAPGVVGIAFVSAGDTVLVNNGVRFPMMSVFKLHESLAVCDALEKRCVLLDSVITVSASELDLHTWSPMLKELGSDGFDISVKDLMSYALVSSDNNASNLLFTHIVSPAETDRYIRTVAADTTFSIRYSEAQMQHDNDLSYCNYSSPLSACLLIRQVFLCDVFSAGYFDAVREALSSVTTGQDRLGAPLTGKDGVLFAHKTGSGYRNARGELIAHNDVAYVQLPDGRDYGLAVMIRDFAGVEEDASRLMARVSKIVYDYITAESGK